MRLYIVKEGDTLSSIAEKYGLDVQQLLAINPQITDPDNIMPGMKIKLATGPVPIEGGLPEIGHPITPVEQTETPFVQTPVPAVQAGSTGGGSGSQGGTDMQQSSTEQHQQYLTTIPQYFANNPMYSGVGSYGGTPGTTQMHSLTPNPYTPMPNTVQSSHTSMSGGMVQGTTVQGTTVQGTGNMPSNIHVPYPSQYNAPYQATWNPNSWPGGGWPQEYTWSMPFEQMAHGYGGGIPGNVPYQVSMKKPCGCGGGKKKPGHYSLAEKFRSEKDLADEGEQDWTEEGQKIEAVTSSEETDKVVEDLTAESTVQAGAGDRESGEKSAKKKTDKKPSGKQIVNHSRKRNKRWKGTSRGIAGGGSGGASRANVHTRNQIPMGTGSYTVSYGEVHTRQPSYDGKHMPALPWLNV